MSAMTCRACSGRALSSVLHLGLMAPSHRFLTAEMATRPEPIRPLRLVRCDDCALLQLEACPGLELGNGSFAAADDPHAYLRKFQRDLPADGSVVFELPDLVAVHDRLAYDLICHETRSYWSVAQLREVLRPHGLEIVNVETSTNGLGTLRLTVQRRAGPLRVRPSVEAAVAAERAADLDRPRAWEDFAMLVEQSRDLLASELEELQFHNRTVAAYSHGGRGMTTLAYCGAASLRLPCLIDEDPGLHGLLTPGHRVPVVGPDILRRRQFDAVLLLGREWDPQGEGPLHNYWRAGGRVLVPTPKPHYADSALPVVAHHARGVCSAAAFADFG